MPAQGLTEIISILILWGIPLAIILSLGGFVIRAVRSSNARHARIIGHLALIEDELSRVREDLRGPPPSGSA